MTDLLGLMGAPELTVADEARMLTPRPKGLYAALPGTGPAGETCGSCQHIARRRMAGVYLKCELTRAAWTRGAGTDIRARSPACSKWESPTEGS